jgi:hypothetical protein
MIETTIDAVVVRLRDAVPALAGARTMTALDWTALRDLPQPPAAIVSPISDRAGPDQVATRHRQSLTGQVAVVLVVAATDDPAGGRSLRPLADLSSAVTAALAGWCPGGPWGDFSYGGARLEGSAERVLLWSIVFTATMILRA